MEVMNLLRAAGYLKIALVGLEAAGAARPRRAVTAAALPAPERMTGARTLLWAAAAALAVTAHAGALAWALRQPRPVSIEPDPAPAVMINLEPALVAPEAPVEALAADSMDAPEIETSMPEIAALDRPRRRPTCPSSRS